MKFHPSSASRWIACPGSVGLIATLPPTLVPPPGEAAQLGTRLHEAAAALMHGLSKRAALKKAAVTGEEYQEARRTLDAYLDACSDQWDDSGIEERAQIKIGENVVSGIVDFWGWNAGQKRLRVVDLKTGSRPVPARDNLQLLCYAAALLQRFPAQVIELCIVQDGVADVWIIDAGRVDEFRTDLERVVVAATSADPPFRPGPQCRWCPAAIVCDAAHSAAVEAARGEFSAERIIDPQEISEKLRVIDEIVAPYVAAVREAAARFMTHHEVPGYRLSPVRRSRWACDTTAVVRLLRRNHITYTDLAATLSPPAARKLVGDVPSELVEMRDAGVCVRRTSTADEDFE
jgi:hypothetical protein